MRNIVRIALLTSACSFASCPALAQTQPASPAPQDSPRSSTPTSTPTGQSPNSARASVANGAADGDGVGEIIVTAQRRNESLSKTPVSVTVISSDTLTKAQITQSDDLRFAAPGLSVRSGLNSEQVNFSLRGESQDPFSNVRPGVLPYINDVQIGSQGSSSAFYDLQSVQVLKGPQGTLFGRSATGGAILFTTQKPTDKLGGYIDGLYGNFNHGKVEGALNVPLYGDQLMFRIAGFYDRRDGFQYNLFDNQTIGRQRKYGFRPSLTTQFGPSIKNELVVDYYHSNSQNMEGVLSGLLPYTGTGTPYVPAQYLYAGTSTPTATITGECTLQGFAGLGACPPVSAAVAGYYQNYFSNPQHPSTGLTGVLAAQQARGPYIIDSDADNISRTRNTVVTNTTTADVGNGVQIKNIFGYVNVKSFSSYEADGSPFSISETGAIGSGYGIINRYHGTSDELQLLGKTLNDRLEYVFGGYYSWESSTTLQHSSVFDILFGGENQQNNWRITNRTLAGYGQATYHLNDNGLAVTGGIRYTAERVDKQILPGDSFRLGLGDPAPAGYNYDQHRTFDRVSWTGGIQDQITSDLLLYAKASRAFKSGGFNGIVAPKVGGAAVGGDGYGAEQVTDVEGGAKFAGHLGDMPIRTDLAIYYGWIKDSQRAAFALINGGPAAVTVNVPDGRTYGAEFDAEIKPIHPLTLGATFNYTNASFTNGNVFVVGVPEVFDQIPDTPKYSGSVFGDVTIPVTGDLSAVAHGDLYYQSSTTTSPRSANAVGTGISSYKVANFRVGLEDNKAGWSLTANLKNAFKKIYYVGGVQVGEIFQINTLVPGDPRTVTVDLRFKL